MLVVQTKLKMGEMLKVIFWPPVQVWFPTSEYDLSSTTPFILSSLLFFHSVGRLSDLLMGGTLLAANSDCKLIVNKDAEKVIHFSPPLTVMCNQNFRLRSYHQPKGRNPWELLNNCRSVGMCSLWGPRFLKDELFILKEEIKDRLSLYRLYRHYFFFFLRMHTGFVLH